MAGVDEYSLTPEQTMSLLKLIERGLSGEIERLIIDFRDRRFYIEEWRRADRKTVYSRRAA